MGHPEVYIMVLPAFGIVSEVIPVFARKPIFGYKAIAVATAAIAFLGVPCGRTTCSPRRSRSACSASSWSASFAVAVPTGIKIFNWIATLWRGSIEFRVPLLFAVALIAQFVIGGVTGVILAVFPVDWQLTDTYFVVAHMHHVLFGGALFGILAGLYYWFPKMSGPDALGGPRQAVVLADGDRLQRTFLLQHSAGLSGMPRRVSSTRAAGSTEYNVISTVGSFILAAGPLVTVVNVVWSMRKGRRAGPDPWRANTLEWFTPSPAAGAQLRRDPDRAQPRADEGHPPRRPGARGRARGRDEVTERRPSSRNRSVTRAAGEPDRARFRRLAYLTAALTFALIVVGGVVRISDSGLGCGPAGSGTEGWPLCGGAWCRSIDTNMIVEYAHRILAAAVTILIAYLAWTAWRRTASSAPARARELRRASADPRAGRARRPDGRGGPEAGAGRDPPRRRDAADRARAPDGRLGGPDASPALKPARPRAIRVADCGRALVALLGTIVAGGYMSASQLHGPAPSTGPWTRTWPAARSSPACGGEFLPFGRSEALDIHLTHRAFMYVSGVVLGPVRWPSCASAGAEGAGRELPSRAWVTVVVLIAQVLLGAVNVWAGEHAWLIVAHLAVGTLLWVSLIRFAFTLTSVPERSLAAAGARCRVPAKAATGLMEAGARARPAYRRQTALAAWAFGPRGDRPVGRAHQAARDLAAARDHRGHDVRRRLLAGDRGL